MKMSTDKDDKGCGSSTISSTTTTGGEGGKEDLSVLLFSSAASDKAQGNVSWCHDAVQITTSSHLHGRGLVVSQPIPAGTCLLQTSPTVHADVLQVMRLYHNTTSSNHKSLEQIAETVLLKEMKRCIRNHPQTAASFLVLTTGEGSDDDDLGSSLNSFQNVVLGQGSEEDVQTIMSVRKNITKEELLGIIRHNAFGPDFHNYARMERNFGSSCYHRILGLYPMAAMINHSCTPNVIRFFHQECMMVHSVRDIEAEEELVWSYLPPAQPYWNRSMQLNTKFGIEACTCRRCELERAEAESFQERLQAALKANGNGNSILLQLIDNPSQASSPSQEEEVQAVEWSNFMSRLETTIEDSFDNPVLRKSAQLGFLPICLQYWNVHCQQYPKIFDDSARDDEITQQRQALQASILQLHLCIVEWNLIGSTEHLSLLHFGYDLSKIIQKQNTETKNSEYWIAQLQEAHRMRYGNIANQGQRLRDLLIHTKGILRHPNGLENAKYPFL